GYEGAAVRTKFGIFCRFGSCRAGDFCNQHFARSGASDFSCRTIASSDELFAGGAYESGTAVIPHGRVGVAESRNHSGAGTLVVSKNGGPFGSTATIALTRSGFRSATGQPNAPE